MNIPSTFHITIFPIQDTPDSISRHTSSLQIQPQQIFYLRTIKEWNHLPTKIIEQENLLTNYHITIELIKSL